MRVKQQTHLLLLSSKLAVGLDEPLLVLRIGDAEHGRPQDARGRHWAVVREDLLLGGEDLGDLV